MRYIANASGQVLDVSFGAMINCGGRRCTEYTGAVPDGYDSLIDWFTQECDKLHRWIVVGGNLVKKEDAPEPAELPPFGMTKVWTNGNASSEFGAETVGLSFAPTDRALIYFREGTDAAARVSLIAEYGVTCRVIGKYGNAITNRGAKMTADGVTFTEGIRMLTYGEWSEANKVLIPAVIYKITGVTDLTAVPDVHATCGTFLCGEVFAGQ